MCELYFTLSTIFTYTRFHGHKIEYSHHKQVANYKVTPHVINHTFNNITCFRSGVLFLNGAGTLVSKNIFFDTVILIMYEYIDFNHELFKILNYEKLDM